MRISEPLVSQHMVDTDFRAALTTDPEAALAARGLTLTETERELVTRLRPLLALSAEPLLQRLLDDGPDGGPWWWASYPSLAAYLP